MRKKPKQRKLSAKALAMRAQRKAKRPTFKFLFEKMKRYVFNEIISPSLDLESRLKWQMTKIEIEGDLIYYRAILYPKTAGGSVLQREYRLPKRNLRTFQKWLVLYP